MHGRTHTKSQTPCMQAAAGTYSKIPESCHVNLGKTFQKRTVVYVSKMAEIVSRAVRLW